MSEILLALFVLGLGAWLFIHDKHEKNEHNEILTKLKAIEEKLND